MPKTQMLKTKTGNVKNLIHTQQSMHGLRDIVKHCQETGPLSQNYTIGWYPNRKDTRQ